VEDNAGEGVSVLTTIGSDAKGLGAIGHLLYASDHPDVAACAYLVAMGARVEDAAGTVAAAWDEHIEGGWSATFPTTQDGIEMLVNDVIASTAEAARYLGDPPAEMPLEHDDGRDFDEIEARMIGVRDVYQGAGGLGLSRLVQLAFAPTDERMSERLQTALTLLGTNSSAPTSEQYLATYEAVAGVHRTLATEIASQLGATLMFGDSDGDS
jgi:predicted lipoprotein